MGILLFIVFGALVGWLTSVVMGSKGGILFYIVLGIIGSLIWGLIMNAVGGTGITGFNLSSILIAILGSIILVSLTRWIK